MAYATDFELILSQSYMGERYKELYDIMLNKIPQFIPKELGNAFSIPEEHIYNLISKHLPLVSLNWAAHLVSFLKSHIGNDFVALEYNNSHNNLSRALSHFNVKAQIESNSIWSNPFKKNKKNLHKNHKNCDLLVVWGDLSPSMALMIYGEWRGIDKPILQISSQHAFPKITNKNIFEYHYFSHKELGDVTLCLTVPKGFKNKNT